MIFCWQRTCTCRHMICEHASRYPDTNAISTSPSHWFFLPICNKSACDPYTRSYWLANILHQPFAAPCWIQQPATICCACKASDTYSFLYVICSKQCWCHYAVATLFVTNMVEFQPYRTTTQGTREDRRICRTQLYNRTQPLAMQPHVTNCLHTK